ncbi:TetR family transcriptional regulator [Rhodococcus sp. IEGM 1409]|uniref:TetR/AcrR family transcriptional regulator n=1 Tax=Rhodococcus sp. IEGM 1409 TaxID=3047082 RepID=UPI0024B642B5|nr:TetR family transcriptional regulator [Rhodococcus sp. IEGM 1409]MDI9903421.1 TetR family transcriptional regulator [Rhodococcus sp. IEGM 1409]
MKSDRRALIAASAVTVIAEQGPRALTHRAVDQSLDLPSGSTSYYFRTREALLEATALHIVHRSRSTFGELRERPGNPAAVTAEYLDDLLSRRRNELIARYALLMETPRDSALHQLLEGSLFSLEKARPIFETIGVDDPDVAATNFLSLLEGLIFDHCLGARSRDLRSSETVRQLRIPIDIYLRGVGAT